MALSEKQQQQIITSFVQLATCDFAFSELLQEIEIIELLDPKAALERPVLDLCFSAWNLLRDIGDMVAEFPIYLNWDDPSAEPYVLLRNLVVYIGRIRARCSRQDWLFESEGASLRFIRESDSILFLAGGILGSSAVKDLLKR